ncbi:MAG TPA: hypothetical protein PKA82_05075 [Pyrinomonadaceae bacterium]|nr:hypothetical protein [Pyrinomonadaceae bacterium]
MTILLFEVMDKMPSLHEIWSVVFVVAIGGFLLARMQPVFVTIPLILLTGFALIFVPEFNDPSVGQHIIREAGRGYMIQTYVALAVGTTIPLIGIIAWHRRKKQTEV